MSVLIKGMKIPKNCIQCEWHEKYGGDYDWCHACRLTGSMPIDNAETGRADDCPLETYEPCTDTISRQAAIDAINALHDKPNAWLDCAVDAVMALPTAQPEIIRCNCSEFPNNSDTISRQAAIDAVGLGDSVRRIKDRIAKLPPVKPVNGYCHDCYHFTYDHASDCTVCFKDGYAPMEPDDYCSKWQKKDG